MKVYGYENNSDNLLELNEVTLKCSIDELDLIIEFLNVVKKEHQLYATELCHSHFQDWYKEWKSEMTDIIVVTE